MEWDKYNTDISKIHHNLKHRFLIIIYCSSIIVGTEITTSEQAERLKELDIVLEHISPVRITKRSQM